MLAGTQVTTHTRRDIFARFRLESGAKPSFRYRGALPALAVVNMPHPGWLLMVFNGNITRW